MSQTDSRPPAEPNDPVPKPQARSSGPVDADIIEPVAYRPAHEATGRKQIRLRVLPAVLTSVFSLLAILAWYMFTARAVTLEFNTPPDSLDVQGGLLTLELGGRLLLRPGDYRLVAKKEGYYELGEDFAVTAQASQSLNFELRKLPGFLTVLSTPVDGASVLIDDEEAGHTPITGIEVEPGPHRVVVKADLYLEYVTDMEIEGMSHEQTLTTELEPAWADITVTSEPAGAMLLLDGKETDVTPLSAQIEKGARELELILPGYKVWQAQIDVVAGEAQTLPLVTLEPADGLVSLVTQPTGVNVTVDGRYRGQSPVRLSLTPGRTYRLGLSKAGYKSVTRAVSVASGERRTLRVDLDASLGIIRIDARPADATVLVNGQPRGTASQVLTLPATPQQLEVRKEGYASYRTTITPRPGFDQRVSVILKTEQQARIDALSATERTALNQELRLVRPGRLKMGAPRRERWRRSNEIEREIEITRHFYISTRLVTNQEFRQFLAAHSSGDVMGESLNKNQQPVVKVTWQQAARFCNWLSARESLPAAYVEQDGKMVAVLPLTSGYRLPTEAEWAWAGRYAAGGQASLFPWGDAMPPEDKSGNFADIAAQRLVATMIPDYRDGFEATSPVASFQPNALGLYDVGGNVAEWIHDVYSGGAVMSGHIETDPTGPTTGENHVIRGSSWRHAKEINLRLSYRDYGEEGRTDVGFRVARYAN